MAKRGGLGRGLDALIPEKKTEKPSKNDKKTPATPGSKAGAKSGNKNKSATKNMTGKDAGKKTPQVLKMPRTDEQDRADALIDGMPLKDDPAEKKTGEETEKGREETEKEKTPALPPRLDKDSKTDDVVNVRISLVEPNRDQPRKYFDDDAINELADSIRQFGVIQPLLVQKKDNYYQIIAGERRWRAAKKCGLTEIPVIIRSYSSQEAVEIALIENIQREDLNPMEEAKAYQRLVNEYSLSQEEVAGRVSRSRSAVANSMRLLKLSDAVQEMVSTGELSEGHARALLPIEDVLSQKQTADEIVKEKLSVRQTEKLVRSILNRNRKPERKEDPERTNMLNTLAEQLKDALGTKVSIRQGSGQKGKIEIEYYSEAELDRLYDLLRSVQE